MPRWRERDAHRRNGIGRVQLAGPALENHFRVFNLRTARATDRATENPRVGGSIPPLATIFPKRAERTPLADARAIRSNLEHIEVVASDDFSRIVSAQLFEKHVFRVGSADASWVCPMIENEQTRSCFRRQLRQLPR